MPQTIHKTFYTCDKCGKEISNEEQSWTRWIYTSGYGKITEKKLIRHQDKHQYLYWCETGEGILWINDEFGWKLFSPAELKRQNYIVS